MGGQQSLSALSATESQSLVLWIHTTHSSEGGTPIQFLTQPISSSIFSLSTSSPTPAPPPGTGPQFLHQPASLLPLAAEKHTEEREHRSHVPSRQAIL